MHYIHRQSRTPPRPPADPIQPPLSRLAVFSAPPTTVGTVSAGNIEVLPRLENQPLIIGMDRVAWETEMIRMCRREIAENNAVLTNRFEQACHTLGQTLLAKFDAMLSTHLDIRGLPPTNTSSVGTHPTLASSAASAFGPSAQSTPVPSTHATATIRMPVLDLTYDVSARPVA